MHDQQRNRPGEGAAPKSTATDYPDSSTDHRQPSLEDALRARNAGMQAATYNTDVAWRRACDAAIERLAAIGEFTADDVRSMVGPPVANSPNAFGARFAAASRAGTIVKVGYRQSLRPQRQGGVVAVWRGSVER